MPKTDIAEPSRAKLRRAREDPICTKSSTERDEPSLVIP
jgi:hypothetical protein